jgi:hypothetical protein
MDASTLVFTGNQASQINAGITAMINRVKSAAVDSGIASGPNARPPKPIWNFVGRGIGVPDWAGDPAVAQNIQEYQSPALLFFDEHDEHPVTTTWFAETEITTRLSLYCYMYALGSTLGDYPNIQELKRNITKATLRSLWFTDPTTPGFDAETPYSLEAPQLVTVDYSNALQNKFPEIQVAPPWWVWRIDISMQAWNV